MDFNNYKLKIILISLNVIITSIPMIPQVFKLWYIAMRTLKEKTMRMDLIKFKNSLEPQ